MRAAFAPAWRGYRSFAWGTDELLPTAQRGEHSFGMGLTLVDSLDTMLLMGLWDEYERARSWLVRELPKRLEAQVDVAFFEVSIRALGGLLGAYTLTSDDALLSLADRLPGSPRGDVERGARLL
mgnify:CR=1 FL=1